MADRDYEVWQANLVKRKMLQAKRINSSNLVQQFKSIIKHLDQYDDVQIDSNIAEAIKPVVVAIEALKPKNPQKLLKYAALALAFYLTASGKVTVPLWVIKAVINVMEKHINDI